MSYSLIIVVAVGVGVEASGEAELKLFGRALAGRYSMTGPALGTPLERRSIKLTKKLVNGLRLLMPERRLRIPRRLPKTIAAPMVAPIAEMAPPQKERQ